MSQLTPQEIVEALDEHIVGQANAKRAVAIALRNRWRRMQVDDRMQKEITPKNILMIGPTGVGKTEIARRLAKLAHSPFIKVEATKFTEVGYVGKDVESIIRDLVETSVKMARESAMSEVRAKAEDSAIERVLDILVPKRQNMGFVNTPDEEDTRGEQTRQKILDRLLQGDFNDKEIEIDVQLNMGVEIMAPPGMEEMTSQLQSMFSNFAGNKKQKQKLKVKEAIPVLIEEEAQRLINDEEVKQSAIAMAEQTGIVFIDEIDKVARRSDSSTSGEVSREGVQRDLLPLVEGCTVNTRYGAIKTDHILFIASGAFHVSKPSDLVPELQGRLPIRVELDALGVEEFKRILTEPSASLTAQYIALLATEGIGLSFSEDAITRMAEIAYSVNESTENIGARRLHTLLEKLLEQISFAAPEAADKSIEITAAYVDEHLQALAADEDLSRYIL